MRWWLAPALLVALPAHAHSLGPGAGDFFNGLAHPFLDPLQLLPLVALGIGCAQRGLGQAQPVLLGLPVVLLATAAVIALTGIVLPATVLAGTAAVVLGLVVASGLVLPNALFFALAAFLAVALASLASLELGSQPGLNPVVYCGGTALGAFLLLSYSVYVADRLLVAKAGWLTIALRVVGSWIAAAALMLLMLHWRLGAV